MLRTVMAKDDAPAPLAVELTVPGEERSLRLVSVFLHEAAEMSGLPPERTQHLLPAVSDAFSAIAGQAFAGDAPGTMSLHVEAQPHTWTLCLREHGLPLDETVEDHLPGGTPAAAAWQHVHDVADAVRWRNLGTRGSELEMVLDLPQQDVTDHESDPAPHPPNGEAPLAPPQEYTIRRMRPEEAIRVAQCVYRAYGYTYPNDDLYYPERIVHLNATGQLLSVVAVDKAGDVVGHLALERPELTPYGESGQAVVMPEHRGRHLLDRMRQFEEEEARRMGLTLIWSEPVTSHPFSQRTNEQSGSRVCGVALACMPASMNFKKIQEETGTQRQSCMFYVKYLALPTERTIYVPEHHRSMVSRLYEHLGLPIRIAEGHAARGTGRITVSMDRPWGTGLIRVLEEGRETAAELAQALHDLVETAGAAAVYLQLPLSRPGTPDLCRAAERLGFFFSAVAPDFFPDGDALQLQYLDVPLDVSQLQIASSLGEEIVQYAASERDRVAQ